MARLSSRKAINSAADDAAAGFDIAERITTHIRGLNIARTNINEGLSMFAVVENAISDKSEREAVRVFPALPKDQLLKTAKST